LKYRKLLHSVALPLLAILPIAAQTSVHRNVANDIKHRHHHYKLIDMGTFGGPKSYVNIPLSSYAPVLNNRGVVTGWADTSTSDPFPDFCFNEDCFTSHAFMWHAGQMTDIGVLPGGASSASLWMSPNGLIAGYSQNGQIDPLVTGLPEIRAVLWREGGITDLGTMEGGYESLANAVNDEGAVAGAASNTVSDPFPAVDGGASSGLGYQTRAFLSLNGTMQDLGTLGTGTDATAYLVNQKGQVAGDSFTDQTLNTTPTCGQNGPVPTQDPFFWDKDKGMIDIGTLGGVCGFASGLNNRGQVVGLSDLAGDQQWHAYVWDQRHDRKPRDLGTFGGSNSSALTISDAGHVIGWANLPGDKSIRAFLWRNGKKANLGSLHSDPCSLAFSLNSNDQVVGVSVPGCDFNNESGYRAFLWEDDGGIVDLNTLIPHGSDLHLSLPETINDRGEIAGIAFLPNGDQHAFLLIPCDENNRPVEGCDYSLAGPAATESTAPTTHKPTIAAPRSGRRPSTSRPKRWGMRTSVENGNGQQRIDQPGLSDDPADWADQLEPEKHAMQDFDTLRGGRCARRGSQCPPWVKCCPGLKCIPASTRAFCEP
jgi:probable HAF family extracellular repeat protein